jgi:hypothetical protein
VKLDQFHDVCQQRWEDAHGDVQELYLTEDSYDELWEDILVNRTRPVSLLNVSAILNSATRSEVRIRITKSADFVMVYYAAGRKEKVNVPSPG